MKINCDVINDLLPLYIENMLSKSSRELVDEHISECSYCQQKLKQLSESNFDIEHNMEEAKSFKKMFRKHTASIAATSAFVTVALIIWLWGIFFLQSGDEMGYSLLNFYLFLPLTALICSIIIGKRQTRAKWLIPLLFGVIGGLLPFAVFHSFDMIFLLFAFIPSVIGLLTGILIQKIQKRKGSCG